jgi:hypothetical protein
MDDLTGAAAAFRKLSPPKHTPQSCHWGQPTLFLAFPEWLGAWDVPWTCCHPARSGPLETIAVCTTCPLWNPLEAGGEARRLREPV